MGTQLPLPKKAAKPSPQFSVHVHCGQMAGWIKTALGTEVGLGPSHIVLDADAAPLPKGGSPIFGPFLLWPNSWMHQDATWHASRPQPRRLCVRWGSSTTSRKGGQSTLSKFWPMSNVAKRLDGSRWHLAWRWALVQATLC